MANEIIERMMRDPKKREKFFIAMAFAPIVVSVLVVVGFVIFILIVTGVL